MNVFTTAHPLARAIGSLGSHCQENTPIDKTDHSHLFTDISDQCSGLADANGSVQGLSGDTHQLLRVFINVAHRVGFVQVRMQALGGFLSARQAGNSDYPHRLCRKKHLSHTRVHGRSSFWFSFARFDKMHDPSSNGFETYRC